MTEDPRIGGQLSNSDKPEPCRSLGEQFGNRTCKDAPRETIHYAWDEDSRLTVAEPPAGKTSLTYRGDGRRVRKETPGDTTKFIYDGHRLLEATDGSDQPRHQYTSTVLMHKAAVGSR